MLIDLERLTDALVQADPVVAQQTVGLITEAVDALEDRPPIGLTAGQDAWELLMSRGVSGRLALYSREVEHDIVLVVDARHQREAGFVSEWQGALTEAQPAHPTG